MSKQMKKRAQLGWGLVALGITAGIPFAIVGIIKYCVWAWTLMM